jgi:hypothetical protein
MEYQSQRKIKEKKASYQINFTGRCGSSADRTFGPVSNIFPSFSISFVVDTSTFAMDPFNAKLVAAGTGSMLTAITSSFVISPCPLITHFYIPSDPLRCRQDQATDSASKKSCSVRSSSTKYMLPTESPSLYP